MNLAIKPAGCIAMTEGNGCIGHGAEQYNGRGGTIVMRMHGAAQAEERCVWCAVQWPRGTVMLRTNGVEQAEAISLDAHGTD